MYDVFISYAREDWNDFARPLYLALSNLNIKVWLDEEMLELGKPVNKDICKAIEESKYGVALLTKNYFKEGKEESTLYELELFKNKQEKFGDFIFLVFCEHLDHFLNNKKDLVPKEPFYIYWNKGIIKVIEIIVKKVRPELPYSNIELMMIKEPPIPKNQQDAVVLIRMYRDEGRNQEASVIALKYLVHHKDVNILKLYLNSVEATNNEILIAEAIGIIFEWFKERPDDQGVHENFISFIKKRKVKPVKMIIDDISEWLKNTHNINIKAGYISLVLEKGSPEQVNRAILEGKEWLLDNDNTPLRIPYFQLVVSKGNFEEIKEIIEETIRWLDMNQKDHDLRTVYIKYVIDKGNDIQKRDIIEMCEKWLKENEADNFLLPTYLNIVEDYNDQKYIDNAFDYIQNWLSLPVHKRDIRVREKYIKFVQSRGSPEQIAKVIKDAKDWLEEVESTNQNTGNIRIGLLNMVEQKGTPEQVIEEIDGTLQWLTKNEDNTNVRASLLDLVKARCNDNSLKNSLFENYIDWLNKNKNNEKTIEVRRRFINYISRKGSCDQKKRLRYDTEIWLNDHDKNFEVKKSLSNLESSLYGCY